MANTTIDLLSKLNLKIDNIEKLLQLLLVNNLIDDVEQIVKISDDAIVLELQNTMDEYGVKFEGFKSINDIEVLIVEIPDGLKLKVKDLCFICAEIKKNYPNKEPLLMFKTLNGMQRKRIIQEEISFGVLEKELHITNRRIKR